MFCEYCELLRNCTVVNSLCNCTVRTAHTDHIVHIVDEHRTHFMIAYSD